MKTDYRKYRLSGLEWIQCIFLYSLFMGSIGILFFNSFVCVLFLMPAEIIMIRSYAKGKGKKRRKAVLNEFKEMIISLAANMEAGYSLERAFYAVYEEMKNLYQGKSYIEQELLHMIRGIEMNESVEILLLDFGERSGNADIADFSQVVAVAKRSGGNLVKIIKKTAEQIGEKIEVENEIDTMITAKRLEQRIMSIMPFGIILYLRFANQGYLDILYESLTGRIVMLVCLVLVCVAVIWSKKIVDIEV